MAHEKFHVRHLIYVKENLFNRRNSFSLRFEANQSVKEENRICHVRLLLYVRKTDNQ